MKTVCIMCPLGCNLVIEDKNGEIIVSGNNCIRGKDYGENEIKNPVRIITTAIKLEKGTISVKTSKAIPKSKIFDCQREIAKLKPHNVKVGDVLLKNILGFDADVVVTGVFVDN